ncbi:uncharacterized protein LOC110437594 [Sorghum bicolor]|uniref:uncharacterized protein LOC110437594 n=1 Tax=Sorghum bicolor TaxID=4558 RepID=UPI000B424475|nr:uncharacterized protein LOC110437594 [Sorghum bicolor]|eukprot:XP_021321747.1 uncharacterized protein LOC110437594 [Sorghum bicolor]
MEHRDVQGNTDNEDNDDSYVIGDSEKGLHDASGDDSIDDDLSDEDDLSGEEEFGDARATNRLDIEVDGDDEIFEDVADVDSDDDRPVRRLTKRAFADGGLNESSIPDVSVCPIIRKGLLFATMDELKSWLQEYSILHHRPFRVINSYKEKRYTVACEEQLCQWRLNSRFIARQLCPIVKHMPTITVSALVETIFQLYNYYVKYGKAWRAKQRALEIIFGNWEEAYERLPVMLNAMKAANPRTHFEYVPKVGESRNGREVFGRAFWVFGQSIEAFKHCRPVVSIDGTFFRGKFEGTMLICIGTDVEDQLVPLAFAIVRKEDTDSWCWFLRLRR